MSAELCEKCGAELPPSSPAECLECGAPVRVHRRMSRAERRKVRRWRESQYSPEDMVNHAVHEVAVPALGLLYLGVFNAFAGLFAVGFGVFGLAFPLMKLPPTPLFVVGMYLLISGVLTFVAGLWMQKAKLYPLCVMGCVLAISGAGPWWMIGLPIGILGLYKLTRPRVRQGFAANRPDFDPDQN